MAKGSHATLGGWEPKTCTVCGEPVRVTVDNCQYEKNHVTGHVYAWHSKCRRTQRT